VELTAIDLFCGAGGLTQGLHDAGFKTLLALDIEPVAIETFKMNHAKKVPHILKQDIKELSAETIFELTGLKKGELDLLAGCPPCQGFSSMRTKNGKVKVDDPRNDLVFQYMRLVRELLPKAVMMENVPGLAKDDRMKKVLSELKELGYHVDDETVQVVNLADYGVPQRRRRMALATVREKPFTLKKPNMKKKTVKDTIGGGKALPPVGTSGDILHDWKTKRTQKMLDYFEVLPKDGGSRSDTPKEYWRPCHLKYPQGFKDVYGRMKWDDVAPTITGGCDNPSKGRFIHPEENRAITLREAALLQTFPKNYKFSTSKGKTGVALMIGNALPPKFIKYVSSQLKETLLSTDKSV